MSIKNKISKIIISIVFVGGIYACSDDLNEPAPVEEEGIPIELSIAIDKESATSGLRSSENPNDYGQESKIYSLEVFIFKTTGELDGYKIILPEVEDVSPGTANMYYDKKYKEVYEITDISLTSGERYVYVIANPGLIADGVTSKAYNNLPPNPKRNTGSYNAFRQAYAELEDQGYVASPGNRFPDNDGIPIGGKEPLGLQSTLTMTAYQQVLFSGKHIKHYMGYTTSSGKPGDVAVKPLTEYIISNEPFFVERLVARVGLKKVTFDFPGEGLLLDSNQPSEKVTDFNAILTGVFMMNVQSQVRFWNEADNTPFAGQYVHGFPTGYNYLKNLLPKITESLYFEPEEPKSLLEENIHTNKYDIEDNDINSSPLWFYAFENQDGNSPTYLVLSVKYNFESRKDPGVYKTATCYYPVVVNTNVASSDHDYIKKNYQYWISVQIIGLASTYDTDSPELIVRSAQESDWDNVMKINQEVGENLFPWIGNQYQP